MIRDILGSVLRMVPDTLKSDLKRRMRDAAPIDANEVLASLYVPTPMTGDPLRRKSTWRWPVAERSPDSPTLPIPPSALTMGYANDGQDFLRMGKRTAEALRAVLQKHGESVGGGPVLEWGCATGRVLRHFAPEAAGADFWGIDVDGAHLGWAKMNLSPPFKFVTCTAFPHLPFEDNHFHLVYGISVFTHLVHLIDTWLMEFRRILAPGGCALFTIHDEHTLRWCAEHPQHRPQWAAADNLAGGLEAEVTVLQSSDESSWSNTFTFFQTEWVRREWGRYMEVVAIEPYVEDYQTAVLLKKR